MTCVQVFEMRLAKCLGTRVLSCRTVSWGFLKLVFRADSAYSVAIRASIPRYVKIELRSPWQTLQP